MSIKLMVEALDSAPVRGGTLLFLIALCDQADDDDRCAWPGAKQLAHRSRCDERSAYRHAERLQRQNIIERMDAEERPSRYAKSRGRETTCWRIKPMSSWLPSPSGDDDAEEKGMTDLQTCQPDHPTPGRRVRAPLTRVSIEPSSTHQRESRRKNTRRVAAGEGEDIQAVGSLDLTDGAAEVNHPGKTQNAVKIASYFNDKARTYSPMDPRGFTKRTALENNIKKWRTERGYTGDEILAAVDLYFGAEHYMRPAKAHWEQFIWHIDTVIAKVRTAGSSELTDEEWEVRQRLTFAKTDPASLTDDEWLAQQRGELGGVA